MPAVEEMHARFLLSRPFQDSDIRPRERTSHAVMPGIQQEELRTVPSRRPSSGVVYAAFCRHAEHYTKEPAPMFTAGSVREIPGRGPVCPSCCRRPRTSAAAHAQTCSAPAWRAAVDAIYHHGLLPPLRTGDIAPSDTITAASACKW